MVDSWEMFDNFGNVKDILGIWRYLGDIIFAGVFGCGYILKIGIGG